MSSIIVDVYIFALFLQHNSRRITLHKCFVFSIYDILLQDKISLKKHNLKTLEHSDARECFDLLANITNMQ